MEIVNKEMRIWCADEKQLTAEVATKPYVLKLELPVGAQFLGAFNLPNLMTVLGFGQGGPPGYAFLVDPEEDATCVRYFASQTADAPFLWKTTEVECWNRGLLTLLGVPVVVLELVYDMSTPGIQEALERGLKMNGVVIDGVRYHTPPSLLKAVASGGVDDEEAG